MKIHFFFAFLTTQNHLSESPEPIKMMVIVGNNVRFSGPNDPSQYPTVSWVFSNHHNANIVNYLIAGGAPRGEATPAYQDRILSYAAAQTFVLLEVKEADTGIYNLIVTDSNITLKHVELSVFNDLLRPHISSNSNRENSVIALTCTVSTKVQSITWFAAGIKFLDKRFSLIDNNRTLIINMAQQSDSGTYTCLVENPFARASSFFQLTIK
ncbi:cell adhesion molecule CEACAM7-like, partial [Cetorhinus maximus]